MIYRFRPHPRYRASCYVNADAADNPGLPPGNWVRAYTDYERREEELGRVTNTPSVLRTEGIKTPSDFFGPGGVGVAVSALFKVLIQSFEPDLHEFQEISLTDERGKRWPNHFFLWRVKTYVQAIDLEKSSIARHKKYNGVGEFLSLESPQKLVLREEIIKNFHIWRNEPNFGQDIFCSDEFHDACKESGVKYLLFNRCV